MAGFRPAVSNHCVKNASIRRMHDVGMYVRNTASNCGSVIVRPPYCRWIRFSERTNAPGPMMRRNAKYARAGRLYVASSENRPYGVGFDGAWLQSVWAYLALNVRVRLASNAALPGFPDFRAL